MFYRNPSFRKDNNNPDDILEELKKVGVLPDNYNEGGSDSDDSSD
jgi:hypothetical protein